MLFKIHLTFSDTHSLLLLQCPLGCRCCFGRRVFTAAVLFCRKKLSKTSFAVILKTEKIFSGAVPAFDVNFIDPKDWTGDLTDSEKQAVSDAQDVINDANSTEEEKETALLQFTLQQGCSLLIISASLQ